MSDVLGHLIVMAVLLITIVSMVEFIVKRRRRRINYWRSKHGSSDVGYNPYPSTVGRE